MKKFSDIIKDFFIWLIESWPGRFWNFSYPALVSSVILFVSIISGFTVFHTDNVIGLHVSFENSLLFAFGIFFTLFLYKIESKRNLALLSLRIEEKKGKLLVITENKHKKNYVKNIENYIYCSDENVTFLGYEDMTDYNYDNIFLLENDGGKCWIHNQPFITSDNSVCSVMNYENASNKKIKIKIETRAENAFSKSEEFTIFLDQNNKINKILNSKENNN
ncbi:MAG: hypothetical protein PHQ18_04055 [Patescibacteria group bacterium]|nr:hypothetical protein [Patescibacteria group bacterium]